MDSYSVTRLYLSFNLILSLNWGLRPVSQVLMIFTCRAWEVTLPPCTGTGLPVPLPLSCSSSVRPTSRVRPAELAECPLGLK